MCRRRRRRTEWIELRVSSQAAFSTVLVLCSRLGSGELRWLGSLRVVRVRFLLVPLILFPDVSGESDLGNKPGVDEEAVMDVIVWAESEERERWWRQVMGVAPAGERGVGIEAGELTTSGFSGASRRRGSAVRSIQGVTAA